jgi:hypothetical protein
MWTTDNCTKHILIYKVFGKEFSSEEEAWWVTEQNKPLRCIYFQYCCNVDNCVGIQFNPLKPCINSNSAFCIYVFRMILRINSDYFRKLPLNNWSSSWRRCVFFEVWIEFLNIAQTSFSFKGLTFDMLKSYFNSF